MEDEDPIVEESPKERKRLNIWLIVALLAAVAAGVLLASTVWDDRWSGNAVITNEMALAETPADLQTWCAAQSTYDAIRRELFRRAAQVRGSDEQAYTRLADFALLRMSRPVARGVDEQVGSVTCSAAASLDLPPGVAVAGGRRSMAGDLDYIVQSAADGSGTVVRLGNADAIVVPLATLVRTGAPRDAPLVPPALEGQLGNEMLPVGEGVVGDDADDGPGPTTANPSFDCGNARSRGEITVCNDPGLAALDRQMAAQFNAALSDANGRQRALLHRTRSRFLAFRDRCASSQCVAETYRSRMREISDIMADRWRG
jgi:uncharacterized protein YecT (DUF1311 family)